MSEGVWDGGLDDARLHDTSICIACEKCQDVGVTMPQTKRMGRPPKTSRQQILDAAACQDPATLRMTTIAADLEIAVRTVYYYFPTRQSLIAALTERDVAHMGLIDVDELSDWREVISELAHWCYRVTRQHPGSLLDTVGHRGVSLQVMRRVLGRLRDLGWSQREAILAYTVASQWALTAGEAAGLVRAAGGLTPELVEQTYGEYAEPDEVTQLAGALSSLTLDDMFDHGLAVVLAGIHATIPPR